MPPERFDERRREIIGGLEEKYEREKAKHRDAVTKAEEAEAICAELEATIRSVEGAAPNPVFCIFCLLTHGRESELRPMLKANYTEDWSRKTCDECGYEQDDGP